MGPLPKRVQAESGARWAATAAFLGCTTALMWTLGVTMSPTVGLGVGAAVFGVAAAVLWGRFLEDVRDERTRASNPSGGRVPFRAEVDDDEPAQPVQSAQRARSNGYYDDEDD